jgi:hypothetical protein
MSEITEVEKLADPLPALIEAEKATLAVKQNEMEALEKAGLIYANEHWRSGKYLYLIYPSRDRQRERKYIGADSDKIEAAQASIRRANEYDRLAIEAARIERILQQGCELLRGVIDCLSERRAWRQNPFAWFMDLPPFTLMTAIARCWS